MARLIFTGDLKELEVIKRRMSTLCKVRNIDVELNDSKALKEPLKDVLIQDVIFEEVNPDNNTDNSANLDKKAKKRGRPPKK